MTGIIFRCDKCGIEFWNLDALTQHKMICEVGK